MKQMLLYASFLVICISGCNIEEMRAYLRGTPIDEKASLTIECQPSSNVYMYLNGKKITEQAPYTIEELDIGLHKLRISSPGYISIELPIQIEEAKKEVIQVQLRPLPTPQQLHENERHHDRKKVRRKTIATYGNEDEEDGLAEDLYRNKLQQPIQIKLAITPSAKLILNGKVIGQHKLVSVDLLYDKGSFIIHSKQLARSVLIEYSVRNNNRVYLHVPEEIEGWSRNGIPIQYQKRTFLLGRQPQRFDLRQNGRLKQAIVFKLLSQL